MYLLPQASPIFKPTSKKSAGFPRNWNCFFSTRSSECFHRVCLSIHQLTVFIYYSLQMLFLFTSTGYRGGRLHAHLVCTMTCGGQPMPKSVCYTPQTGLVLPSQIPEGGRVDWPRWKVRTRNLESKCTRQPAPSQAALCIRCPIVIKNGQRQGSFKIFNVLSK